jgi:hypothetical protein
MVWKSGKANIILRRAKTNRLKQIETPKTRLTHHVKRPLTLIIYDSAFEKTKSSRGIPTAIFSAKVYHKLENVIWFFFG